MKSQDKDGGRLKIIIVATVALAIVFIAGICLISAAIKNVSQKTGEALNNRPTETAIQSAPVESSNAEEQRGTEATSPADSYVSTEPVTNESKPVSSQPSQVTSKPSEVPSTGPASLTFTAILIGVSVFLLGKNIQLAKS